MLSYDHMFEKIAPSSLKHQALTRIRQAIIDGELKPGHALRENEVAAQMGISRVPVREALLVLEEEGLVERIPFKGTFVSTFTRQDIEELYSLRTVLECFGVELLIEHLTDDTLADLWAIIDEMRAAAAASDADLVNQHDITFHELLMQRAGHKRLLKTWQDLRLQIRRVVVAGNILNFELDTIVRNHLPIMAALEGRDLTAARDLIRQHISDSGRRVIANWERIAAENTTRDTA